PRGVLDDRLPAAQDPVHQRRLAHVGPADDGDNGYRASLVRHHYLLFCRACGTSPTMMPTTASRPSPVESISTASAAFPLCAASSRSRRSWSARVDQLASAARRPARAAPSAVRNTLTGASGATTVPMSRRTADDLPLHGDQVRADLRDGRDGADRGGDLTGPDRLGHVGAVDPGPRRPRVRADLDDRPGGQRE